MSAAAAPAPAKGAQGERADLAAWLAVAAGTLGALMATLDISIVNSSLPTIQGEIGASGTEGTWIATAYLVSEIIIIPLSGWLERLLGLRNLLLIAAVLFTGFSVLCGVSTDLTTMIIGRVGQGFTGGAMIPTAMTIIATRLPPAQQPIGTSLFGATAVLGPVVGPLLGGWLTEQFSWHYAFFINLPVCFALLILLLIGLPHEKVRLNLLSEADWLGIFGLAIGLGALTVVLEEGQRELWFSSPLIGRLTAVAVVGFMLLLAGQFTARRPVIRLSLLLNRSFGSVFVASLVLGAVLYGVAFVIPQFLAALAGYDAMQAGEVVFISGVPSFLMMPLLPLLIRYVDVRIAVAAGMLILALSCYIDTALTAESAGGAFTDSQLLRGVGQMLAMLFLNQAAISAVSREEASDAAGLFNVARNLGGSIGLAMIATVQEQRLYLHERQIEATLSANSPITQDYLSSLGATIAPGGDMEAGAGRALRLLGQQISEQALVMVYNDLFYLLAVSIVVVTPLVLFLKPLRQRQPVAMH